jgi:hypothetical protein
METSSSIRGHLRSHRDLFLWLGAGLITGLVGVVLFGLVHHLLIEPIWTRLGGGIPFAMAGGAAMGWTFHELQSSGRFSIKPRDGALFGLLLWINIIPLTLIAAALRVSGIRHRMADWDTVSDCVLAFLTGVLAGWLLTRKRKSSLVFGAAMVVIVLMMAGPIAISNSERAAFLFLSFLGIYLLGGVVLIAARQSLGALTRRRATPPPD